jgi:hypothetical protein
VWFCRKNEKPKITLETHHFVEVVNCLLKELTTAVFTVKRESTLYTEFIDKRMTEKNVIIKLID